VATYLFVGLIFSQYASYQQQGRVPRVDEIIITVTGGYTFYLAKNN